MGNRSTSAEDRSTGSIARDPYSVNYPIIGIDITACQAVGHSYFLLDGPFFKMDRLGSMDRRRRYWLFCCSKCGHIFEYYASNEVERA